MAEYNGKQGRWITTKDGRHLFIEDEVDKQEREIKESKAKQDAFNKDREDEPEDIVATNPLYKGLKVKCEKALKMPEDNEEQIREKEGELYQLLGEFDENTYKSATAQKIHDEQERLGKTIEYEINTRKGIQKALKEGNKDYAKKELNFLRKMYPDDIVTDYGMVLHRDKNYKSLTAFKNAVTPNTDVHMVNDMVEKPTNPTGTTASYKGWKDWNWGDGLQWGWFTDTDGKRKIWFVQPD